MVSRKTLKFTTLMNLYLTQ